MKNINARIDWKNGMELSAQTFVEMHKCYESSQKITRRIACGAQFGILPMAPVSLLGVFVKKTLEISPLTVTALMPSGDLLHVDEDVVVEIPMLYGKEYYLGCSLTDKMQSYDKERVPMLRPKAEFGIYTLEELANGELLPLMKFKVEEGVFSIEQNYIPPFLLLDSDKKYATLIQSIAEKVEHLATHANLESGEAKRGLIRYAFMLKNYSMKNRVQQLVETLQELVHSVDYYIIQPNTKDEVELKECSFYDVASWLQWLEGFLHGALTLLDGVVLEDHTIDFEELKAQIKDELYQKLYPELKEQLYTEVHDTLKREIADTLMESLSEYINGNFKREIYRWLEDDMARQLHEKLYSALYEALYNALYVQPEAEEEDNYMPLI